MQADFSGSATPPERGRAVEEYKPAEKKTEKTAKSARQRQSTVAKHSPTVGARLTPTYIERTPQMWAVGEVDIKAISDDSLVANVAFSIASFFLGLSASIFVDYAGMDKLSDVGRLMLYKISPLALFFALGFGVLGIVMNIRKNAIWEQIKKETNQLP